MPVIIAKRIIRSKTVGGEFCKQYFRVIVDNQKNSDVVVSIHKLVFTDRFELYEMFGFEVLKQFKTKRLYRQIFTIKLETLNRVANWVKEI